MIELIRHIETLLLESDCVIVPDFGGFTAHYIPARYDKDEQLFFPPLRTLGFNPQLRINDSLLAQSYINTYDISYPEALRRISDEVEEIKHTLDEEGYYTMSGIGMLSVNADGNYEFAPCEAGILSPIYYGLPSVNIRQLKDKAIIEKDSLPKAEIVGIEAQAPEQESAESPTLLELTDTVTPDTISVKMSWVRNAIAVAAAVVAFFFFVTPVANSDLSTTAMSNLQGNLIYKLMPQDSNMAPAEPVIETMEAKAEDTHVEKTKEILVENVEETPAAKADKRKDTYYIVLASQVKKSNAEAYVEQLHRQGYNEAKVYVNHGIVRVVCGEFTSQEDAYKHLSQLHKKEQFEEAWVYKEKAEA